MLHYNTIKQSIINAVSKKVFWAFEITGGTASVVFSDEGGFSFSDEAGYIFSKGGETYYWSTVARTWNGNDYEFKIDPQSFNGVLLSRNKSEFGVHTPNILEFDVINVNNEINPDDLLNAILNLKLIISDYSNEEVIREWEFYVKRIDPGRQLLHFYCVDYISAFLKGDYPNTKLIKDIFPSEDTVIDDNVCIPEPYGIAYIPLRSIYDSDFRSYTSTTISVIASSNSGYCKIVDTSSGLGAFEIGRTISIAGFTGSTLNNQSAIVLGRASTQLEFSQSEGLVTESAGDSVTLIQGSRSYILGSTDETYIIERVRSPRIWGKKSEWNSSGYTFTKTVITDPSSNKWWSFQPIINDVDNDGTADSPGYWQQGEVFLDVPTRFSAAGTYSITNPADIIEKVLNNIGISSTRLKIDNNLIAYWSFDEGSGSTIIDNSSNNHTVYTYGNPIWSTGVVGNCLEFSSSSHYAKTAVTFNYPTSQISISCWVKVNALKQYNDIVLHRWLDKIGTWILFASSVGTYFGISSTGSSTGQHLSLSTATIDDGNFHHVVGTYDGTNVRIYIDSTCGSSGYWATPLSVTLDNTSDVVVGGRAYPSMNYMDGHIDEVRIYNKSLSSTEIDELYNYPAMRGWWSYARNMYYRWGLTFNGAFWYKENREIKLAQLLNMCHSVLIQEDKIQLVPLIKASQFTVDNSHVLTVGKPTAQSSFRYRNIQSDEYSDCGYIAWQQDGESQDRFLQLLIGAKNNLKTKISNKILEIPFVQDSQLAQTIGILYYQRLLLRKAILTFFTKSQLIALQPDDVITINYSDYGGTFNVLVENIFIRRNLSLEINCVLFSESFDDWDDLSPSAIVVAEDDLTAKTWEPAITGSLTAQNIGKQLWAKSYLVVGQHTNQGDYTDIQSAINALKGVNYSGVYLRKGIYSLSTAIYFPSTISVDIIGENKSDVIIQPTSGKSAFIFNQCGQIYNLYNFKIASQNSSSQATYSNVISVTSSTGDFNFHDISLSNLKKRDSSTIDDGDVGFYISSLTGSLKIHNCNLDGGEYGAYVIHVNNFSIYENVLKNQNSPISIEGVVTSTSGAYTESENGSIHDNDILDYKFRGVYVKYSDKVDISFNKITFKPSWNKTDIATVGPTGISAYEVNRLKIIGNGIDITSTATDLPDCDIQGIRIHSKTIKANISNNNINIERNSSQFAGIIYGIGGYWQDCQLNNNIVKINSSSTNASAYRYGIYLYAVAPTSQGRNVVQGNHIDCVNNTARDIGIKIYGNLNQGGDNITYNCGISISDSGSSNSVTAKDI